MRRYWAWPRGVFQDSYLIDSDGGYILQFGTDGEVGNKIKLRVPV